MGAVGEGASPSAGLAAALSSSEDDVPPGLLAGGLSSEDDVDAGPEPRRAEEGGPGPSDQPDAAPGGGVLRPRRGAQRPRGGAEAAAHARKCRAAQLRERAAARTAAGSGEAPVVLRDAQARAVADIFDRDVRASGRERARAGGVARQWQDRATVVAATEILAEERRGFLALLEDVRRAAEQGALTPGNFVWCRMYDESPFTLRTHVVDPASGALDSETSLAKVFGGRCRFAFSVFSAGAPGSGGAGRGAGGDRLAAVRGAGGDRGTVAGDAGRGGGGDPPEAGGGAEVAHVVSGYLSSRLATVSSMHAGKVAAVLRDSLSLDETARRLAEAVFPRTAVVTNADLHLSNEAAERMLRRERPRWPSARWRCSFHRLNTAEKRSLARDAVTESAVLNMSLVLLKVPGARKHFAARMRAWAGASLVVYHGERPADVDAWRAQARAVLFPEADSPEGAAEITQAENRRRFCFERVLNGDGRRQDELQHWCSGCCETLDDSRRLVQGEFGVGALLSCLRTFPRKSWLGQRLAAARWTHAELAHGALSQNFVSAKARSAAAVERARAREAAAVGRPDPIAGGSGGQSAAGAREAAEEMAARCGDASAFLARADRVPRLLQMCRVLDCFVPVKTALLARAGEGWERRRRLWGGPAGEAGGDRPGGESSGSEDDAPAGGATAMAAAYEGRERRAALASATAGFAEDTGVAATWAWRQWSAVGGSLTEICCAEVESPTCWKYTALPHRPGLAADLARTPAVALDPVTLQHRLAYPGREELLSARSLAEAAAVAEVLEETTLRIERGWATLRRGLRVKGDKSRAEAAHRASAERVPRELRARGFSWDRPPACVSVEGGGTAGPGPAGAAAAASRGQAVTARGRSPVGPRQAVIARGRSAGPATAVPGGGRLAALAARPRRRRGGAGPAARGCLQIIRGRSRERRWTGTARPWRTRARDFATRPSAAS